MNSPFVKPQPITADERVAVVPQASIVDDLHGAAESLAEVESDPPPTENFHLASDTG